MRGGTLAGLRMRAKATGADPMSPEDRACVASGRVPRADDGRDGANNLEDDLPPGLCATHATGIIHLDCSTARLAGILGECAFRSRTECWAKAADGCLVTCTQTFPAPHPNCLHCTTRLADPEGKDWYQVSPHGPCTASLPLAMSPMPPSSCLSACANTPHEDGPQPRPRCHIAGASYAAVQAV